MSNNLGQCSLQPIERFLRPNLVKLVELFKDRDIFAERNPCLLAAREDLYVRGTPIWVIHGSDTYIPKLAKSNHIAAKNRDAAMFAAGDDLAFSTRCRKFMFTDRSVILDPIGLDYCVQNVSGSSLPLALTAVTAMHEHRW